MRQTHHPAHCTIPRPARPYLLVGTEDGEGSRHGQEPDEVPEQVDRVLPTAEQHAVQVPRAELPQRQLRGLGARPRVLGTE